MAAVRVVVVHVAPRVKATSNILFSLLLSLSLLFLMGCFCLTRVRVAVLDQKVETADLNHLTLRRIFHAV